MKQIWESQALIPVGKKSTNGLITYTLLFYSVKHKYFEQFQISPKFALGTGKKSR